MGEKIRFFSGKKPGLPRPAFLRRPQKYLLSYVNFARSPIRPAAWLRGGRGSSFGLSRRPRSAPCVLPMRSGAAGARRRLALWLCSGGRWACPAVGAGCGCGVRHRLWRLCSAPRRGHGVSVLPASDPDPGRGHREAVSTMLCGFFALRIRAGGSSSGARVFGGRRLWLWRAHPVCVPAVVPGSAPAGAGCGCVDVAAVAAVDPGGRSVCLWRSFFH